MADSQTKLRIIQEFKKKKTHQRIAVVPAGIGFVFLLIGAKNVMTVIGFALAMAYLGFSLYN